MGRTLYVRQKKLLKEWFNQHKDKIGISFRLNRCDFFPHSLLQKLEQINDHETIVQNIESYIIDLVFEPRSAESEYQANMGFST